eukprot:snap_masked-scaffold_6-processed-gene-19.30-mRNA-1 protein AED:1.00 eAED:1.00 QI:0/0/0/0/1/1/3/0/184
MRNCQLYKLVSKLDQFLIILSFKHFFSHTQPATYSSLVSKREVSLTALKELNQHGITKNSCPMNASKKAQLSLELTTLPKVLKSYKNQHRSALFYRRCLHALKITEKLKKSDYSEQDLSLKAQTIIKKAAVELSQQLHMGYLVYFILKSSNNYFQRVTLGTPKPQKKRKVEEKDEIDMIFSGLE